MRLRVRDSKPWATALAVAAFVGIAPLVLPLFSSTALACGGEVPSSCGTDEDDARYLLKQAIAAVKSDQKQALTWFTEQSHGFRTEDLYVYCIGPGDVMDAHPDPKVNGTDIHKSLIDSNGFHFGEEMLQKAREGEISDITYLWPRLDQSQPEVKHTMYTRVTNQICAVGYYE